MGFVPESRPVPDRFVQAMRAAVLALALLTAGRAAAQDDPLRPIADAVRRHADDEALRALATLPEAERASPRARYLDGRLLERRSRAAEALAAFPTGEDAASLPEAVQADARRRAGHAAVRAGECARARALLEPSRDPLAEARLAECALAEGELERAIRELTAVAARGAREVDGFAVRFSLAEALARAGRTEDAVRELTALIVERVEHPEAERAEAALLALRGRPVELSFAQQVRRAERLYDAHRYEEAAAALAAAGRPARAPELRQWLHARGMALFRARRHHYAEAAVVLAESATLGGPHAADDQFHAARALSRSDRDPEAIVAYRRFASEHPSHRLAAEALYLAAWLELRLGLPGGEANMVRFARSAAAARAPAERREAIWQLALRAFETRRYALAERHLVEYARTDPGAMVRGRGHYWLGRARQARGDRDGALESYREALEIEPLHWYALLARQRIEELGEVAPPPFPEPPLSGVAETPAVTLPAEAQFFAALGLRHDAVEAVRRAEAQIRRGPGDGTHRLVVAYQSLGEASRVLRLVGGASTLRRRNAPGPADRWRWDGAFPRPYAREVEAAAPVGGLTPAHMYAVMRQESGYDPDVVSYADAIGLMQLLPRTAIPMARRVGLEVTREMLFDPEINTRIAAAYIGGLVSRFGVPLGFAGFNAGGFRVDEWLRARGRTELDLFVEHIPFEQTRNYTRRVTTHFAHYRYLESPDGGWPIALPTHVEPRAE